MELNHLAAEYAPEPINGTQPEISIVVVTWNSYADLLRLGPSLVDNLGDRYELIVVDNASVDDTVRAAQNLPRCRVVALPKNVGFGRANNIGVKLAVAPAVALLNPDTWLLDAGLVRLAREAQEIGGLIGPRLLYPNGRIQPSCSPLPGGMTSICSALVPHRLLPGRVGREAAPWRFDTDCGVGWLTGAAIVGPREALSALGPFDDSIHMYSEDIDLCIRAKRAGYEVRFAPQAARVVHVGDTASSQRYDDRGLRLSVENRYYVTERAFGRVRARLDYTSHRVGTRLRRWVKWVLGRDASHEKELLVAYARARLRPPVDD